MSTTSLVLFVSFLGLVSAGSVGVCEEDALGIGFVVSVLTTSCCRSHCGGRAQLTGVLLCSAAVVLEVTL